jgi:hypothetical protein
MTVAEHMLTWPDVTVEGEHEAVTDVTADIGFTTTVVVPDLVLSWVEVAVMVTCSDALPAAGAVYKPELDMEPEPAGDTDHVTPELKLPVPITDAEHWLVWP